MDGAKGTVTYCQGKDTAGNAHEMIDLFNEKYESQGLTAKLVEFPASADEQRNQFIQRQQAKSGDCDVFSSDVIWTAEFASQKWLYDMTPYIEAQGSDYIDATIETVTYDEQDLGRAGDHRRGVHVLPHGPGPGGPGDVAGDLRQGARTTGGIVFQGAPYEGLTCDWLEIAFAAGGEVLSEDGTKAVDRLAGERQGARRLMVDAIKDGAAPKAVTTYMEPESLARVPDRQLLVHAQLAVRLRAQPEGRQGQGQVRGRAAPEVRGRRRGEHPGRPQQRDLGLLEEPGRRADDRRLHRLAGDPVAVREQVQPRADDHRGL